MARAFELTTAAVCRASSYPARVVHALNALSARRYRRDLIAREMATALVDGRPEVRRMACAALGRLGSRAVLTDLVQCLRDDASIVKAEAWASLKRLTGADLPAEPEAWLRAYPAG